MSNLQPEVCAVDVGFGFVKYRNGKGNPQKFLSIVSPYRKNKEGLTTGESPETAIVKTEIDTGEYRLVGPGIISALPANPGQRIMNDDFSKTSDYLALLRGALTLMDVTAVAVLQLALPLTTYFTHADELKKAMIGPHTLYKSGKEKYTCFVHRVEVAAQPIGAYANYLRYKKNQGMAVGNNCLIVDVGYFTLDFVVATGNQIFTERSGSTKGGMSVVVGSIIKAFQTESNIAINTGLAQQIEEALGSDNTTIKIFGEKVDFAKFIDSARAEVADHINLLVNTVGNTGDISDIVICGGGAKFFTPLFKKRFPHNNITYRADSQFEVVNGLYAMGLIAFAKVADKSETKEAA